MEILIDLRSRGLRRSRVDIDAAADISASIERLRFYLMKIRDETSRDDPLIFDRIERSFSDLFSNEHFGEIATMKYLSRRSSPNSRRIPLEEIVGSDLSHADALYFLYDEFRRLPRQRSFDLDPNIGGGPKNLRKILPEQKIAPAQFDIVNQKLVVVPAEAVVHPDDSVNVSSARSSLIEQGDRIIQNLSQVNFDVKLKESLLALQESLCDGNDIIKLGMLTMTCEGVAKGLEEQLSSATSELLRAHTSGIRMYLAQFPDWRRFVENAASTDMTNHDVEKIVNAALALVGGLSDSSDVDEEVPKVISFVTELVNSPAGTSKRAAFALLRTIENLISKVFSYATDFIDQVVTKASTKVSGAIATGLATIVIAATVGITGVFKGIPETAWVPDATKIVEQYILGVGTH